MDEAWGNKIHQTQSAHNHGESIKQQQLESPHRDLLMFLEPLLVMSRLLLVML
jgi:hypothetical protein